MRTSFIDIHLPAPGRAAREHLRSAALGAAGALVSRPLLRATIGRWPTQAEAALFQAAFRQPRSAVPPVVRALASVPAARPQLSRAMLVSWMQADAAYRGELTRGLDSGSTDGAGDVLSVWNGPPVAFLHIEKTAGMSVSQALEQQFHPTQINPDVLRADSDEAMRRCALIRGHFDLPTLRRIDPDRFVLTFLREPRTRILSLYQYWRSYVPETLTGMHPGAAMAASMPLLDWLRCDAPEIRDAIDGHYVRRLLGLYDERAAGGARLRTDPAGCLDAAARALDGLGFVGLTEQMGRSLDVLGRRLGFTRPVAAPRVNVTAANPTGAGRAFRPAPREAVTPEIEAELDRLTVLDRALYERAKARLG